MLDVFQHFGAMALAIFVENVVEQFRAHVFRGGQVVLLQIFEDEAGSIVEEFELVGLLFLHIQQDVFGLYIRVDYLVLGEQIQGLGDLQD